MTQKNLKLFSLLIFAFIAISSCEKLLFVQELYRHGARGPFSPYWDGANQTNIQGELTPTGARQHYLLGKQLRDDYINNRQFLSSEYNQTEIYVRSTDTNRTITSANCQLLGLYPNAFKLIPNDVEEKYRVPPFQGVQKDSNLGNNPLPFGIGFVPVHVVEESSDYELQPWDFCDDYTNQVDIFKSVNQNYTNQFDANFSALYEKVSIAVNSSITTYSDVGGVWGGVYEVFVSDMFNGRALPPSLTKEDIDDLNFVNSFSWFYGDFGTDLGTQELVTPFLNLLISNFDNKLAGQSNNLKWIMFSAHDSNLALAMRAMNISCYECLIEKRFSNSSSYLNCEDAPQFASSLIWELLIDDFNQTMIRARFDGKYMNLCDKQSTYCSYEEFRSRIINYILPNLSQTCQGTSQQDIMVNFHQTPSQEIEISNKTTDEYNPLLKYVIIQAIGLIGITCFSLFLLKKNKKLESDRKVQDTNLLLDMKSI